MTQWIPFLPLIGSLVAALVAGAVAFLLSVLSKEQKTSEFRQAWIDALREDIAEAVSLHFLLQDVVATEIRQSKETNSVTSALREKQDEFARMEAAMARVQLRLNPAEHQTLIDLIRQLGTPGPSLREGKTTESDALGERILQESQKVLKAEWARVKRGERTFVATKWTSLVLAIAALAATVVVVARA